MRHTEVRLNLFKMPNLMRALSALLVLTTADALLQKLPRPTRFDAASDEEIRIHTYPNGLAHAVLNRPKKINALSERMLQELLDLLEQAERPHESGVRCIAISGAGERGFCAGGDILRVAGLAVAADEEPDGLPRRHEAGDEVVLGVRGARRAQDYLRLEYAVDELLRGAAVPVVTIGRGLIWGGGQGLWAGASRHRVAAADASLAMPEANIGIVPDAGSTAFLRTHLRSRAEHLYVAFAGAAAALDAAALAERGMASWLAPGDDAAAAEDAVVAALAAVPPPPPPPSPSPSPSSPDAAAAGGDVDVDGAWTDAQVGEALATAGCVAGGATASAAAAGWLDRQQQQQQPSAGAWGGARAGDVAHAFAEPSAAEAVARLRKLEQEAAFATATAVAFGGGGDAGGGREEAARLDWARRTADAIERGCPASHVCSAALIARAWGEGIDANDDDDGAAYRRRLRAALDDEFALNARLGLRRDFRDEGVACAVGARRGEVPAWSPPTLDAARRDPAVVEAIDAAGLADWVL